MTDATAASDNPYHAGERAIHARLHVEDRMLRVGRQAIRDHMPDQHREFYAQLPFVLVGSVDADAHPWASILVGQPGFMQSPDPRALIINALPSKGDPLWAAWHAKTPVGLLGIELHTRRRNRMNGRISGIDSTSVTIAVEQTVGNCPKYIQGREFTWLRPADDTTPRNLEALNALDLAAQQFIENADTFFVASYSGDAVDVSHRGGQRGFVRIENPRTLVVPDFMGNHMFMTLGNMLINPHAGLLFIDFERGDLLQFTGRTEILWDDPIVSGYLGAERAWRFKIDAGWRLRDALPLRWRFKDWSPASLQTGSWE